MDEKKTKKKIKLPRWVRFIFRHFFLILGGLALLLGLAYSIKACSLRQGNKINTLHDTRRNANGSLVVGDIVTPIYQYPVVGFFPVTDGNLVYYKACRCYLTISLEFLGVNEQNINTYRYNSISGNIVVTGDGLKQWSVTFVNNSYDFTLNQNNYLSIWAYDGYYSGEGCEVDMCLYSEDPIRTGHMDLDSYDYRVSGSYWFYSFPNTLGDWLDQDNLYYDGEYYTLPNNDYGDIYLFGFCIEETRLLNLADAYNFGYMQGYLDGIRAVQNNPHNYDLYSDNDMQASYSAGYRQGELDAQGASIPNLIYTIFNAPAMILNGCFNFELFGVNIANLLKFFLTIGAVIFVVKFFKKG